MSARRSDLYGYAGEHEGAPLQLFPGKANLVGAQHAVPKGGMPRPEIPLDTACRVPTKGKKTRAGRPATDRILSYRSHGARYSGRSPWRPKTSGGRPRSNAPMSGPFPPKSSLKPGRRTPESMAGLSISIILSVIFQFCPSWDTSVTPQRIIVVVGAR